jgi:hypothetical protein
MLKSIDILIGFSVIMLAVSMSVTLIIQWILNLSGMRGKKLLVGVMHLLRQIDPALLTPEYAAELAETILKHPMLASGPGKMAEVVQREDLIKTILAVAAAAVTAKPAAAGAGTAVTTTTPAAPARTPTDAEQALITALSNAGIPNPGSTLDSIRMASMKMEAARPELATHVREAIAVIQQAESQFVARLNSGFDQTMERVSHSFANHSRLWAIGISVFLAFLLQLDSFRLLNRLAMDDNLRNSLVQQAEGAAPVSPNQPPLDAATQENLKQLRELATDTLITWPSGWKSWNQEMGRSSIFGLLLTAGLLSLGAPFWFNVLGDLLKLRPMLASKEDAQRKDRETTQPAAG